VNLFLSFFLSFLSGTKMSTHIEKMIRLNSFRHQGRRARMKEQVERAAIFLLRLASSSPLHLPLWPFSSHDPL
jgi:hypothetical protein